MNAITKSPLILFFIGMAVFLSSCSDDATRPRGKQEGEAATLDKRIVNNNEFAFDLYGRLTDSRENLIVSPHSIVTCFGMAYAGAKGNTEKEIADVLRFNYPQNGFHSVLSQLNDELNNRPLVDLRIANGSWGRLDLTYLQSYLDTLSACYGADIAYLDFVSQPEQSRVVINQWVQDHTAGFITELLPPNAINASTYLVLANTVYFMAEWLYQFDPDYTYDGTFTLLDGTELQTPIMHGEQSMPYYVGDGYQAMEMPYKGEQLSMVLILPDAGQYEAFEDTFTTAVLDTVLSRLAKQHITFAIPKFGFYSRFDLVSTLKTMGMNDAFVPGVADFSGMDGTVDGAPWIDLIVHKAYIMIDEYGTLAAAGTGMVLSIGIHPHFGAVRPFIYIIRDIPTGTILFMGRVLIPGTA
jgi:serpin B